LLQTRNLLLEKKISQDFFPHSSTVYTVISVHTIYDGEDHMLWEQWPCWPLCGTIRSQLA